MFNYLKNRKAVASYILIDIVLFVLLFESKSPAALILADPILFILFWIISSYVCGLYFDPFTPPRFYGIRLLANTMHLIIFTFVFVLPSAIVRNASVTPYLVSLCAYALMAYSFHFLLDKFFVRRYSLSRHFIFIGSRSSYDAINSLLPGSRYKINLSFMPLGSSDISLLSTDIIGIIAEDESAMTSCNPLVYEHILTILRSPSSTNRFYNAIEWCDTFLDTIPSPLISNSSILHLSASLSQPYRLSLLTKRIIDVVLSFILILILLPLMVALSIVIVLQTGFPIFYLQDRCGRYGRIFKIIKFRSMIKDSESRGPVWAGKNDPRITPIGSLMRKSRLDELPQLFCILSGQMSLVGPRPERPEFDIQLSSLIPNYSLKYIMTPGLTGWTQVNCNYGASFEDSRHRFEHDIYYARNFSLLLDCFILLKTLRVVLNLNRSEPG